MVLNNYRHILPKFINGPVNFCVKHKITPNQISVIGILLSILASVTLAFPDIFLYGYSQITSEFWWWWICVPGWLFFFGAYVDVLDGAVARKIEKVSKFGGFLDSTLDRLSDATIILGLLLSGIIWPWDGRINNIIAFLALSIVLLISYTRSRAEIEGVPMKGIGFMERAERILILLAGLIIHWAFYAVETQYLGGFRSLWVYPSIFLIFTLLCLQTLLKRIVHTYRFLTKN